MRWRSSDIKAPSRKSRNLLKVCDGKWCPNPTGDQVVERMSHNHNANSNFSCVVVGVLISMSGGKGFVSHLSVEA